MITILDSQCPLKFDRYGDLPSPGNPLQPSSSFHKFHSLGISI